MRDLPITGSLGYQAGGECLCAALIPAFKPDSRLSQLVSDLVGEGFREIVIIDDGSGAAGEATFDALERTGATCLRHPSNLGKGAALRTGFDFILRRNPLLAGVVTLDADGQHSARDAAQIARECKQNPDSLILGIRCFRSAAGAPVPLRSWIGNTISRLAYRPVLRKSLADTQSGLRGIPLRFLPWMLHLTGDGYEYETNMLISVSRQGIAIREAPIQTIYEMGNSSSHFHWLRDSWKIYAVVLRFYFSIAAAAATDAALFASPRRFRWKSR